MPPETTEPAEPDGTGEPEGVPRVSAIHLPDGTTGVSLLVPIGEATLTAVGDQGRVLTAARLRDVPDIAVGLTPAQARTLAIALYRQADWIDGGRRLV